jgi:indole-3-glycerol phosphate synthase
LIDEKYFAWDINRWKIFKQKYNKPIFFKEFVVSKTQIDWASYFGYDAILLLERVLSEKELIEFIKYSNEKNIFPIVEIDTEIWLEKILELWKQNNNSPIIPFHKGDENNNLDFGIAINCRNLWTMEINRKKHFSIIKNFEKKLEKKLVFAFSWIDNLEQLKEYKWIYNGVLVGSYFMERFRKEDI